jgi:hypothetical protein
VKNYLHCVSFKVLYISVVLAREDDQWLVTHTRVTRLEGTHHLLSG